MKVEVAVSSFVCGGYGFDKFTLVDMHESFSTIRVARSKYPERIEIVDSLPLQILESLEIAPLGKIFLTLLSNHCTQLSN